MFKKDRDLTERSKTLLKNKEIRTLKQDIIKQFPLLDEETLNQLIPNKADVHNIKLANRTILYSIDGQVIFYDYQGRNNLYPTLYTLWKCPHMMRTMYTYGPVSRYVLRGADFMIPGLANLENLSGLQENEKVSVTIVGNPLPFAVGDCHVSEDQLLDREGHKSKGKAMTVMHCYGDLLVSTKIVPNDGFTAEEIFPTEKLAEDVKKVIVDATEAREKEREKGNSVSSTTQSSENTTHDNNDLERNGKMEGEGRNELDGDVEDTADVLAQTTLQQEQRANENMEDETMDATEIEEHNNQAEEIAQRDNQLMEALILAFKYIIKEKQLPMLVSVFWSTLQRCHQCIATMTTLDDEQEQSTHSSTSTIDIKKTSYKKVSKFLDYCKGIDLLTYREENGISTITGVKRMHDLFREYKAEDPEKFKEAVSNAGSGSGGGGSGSTDSSVVGYHTSSNATGKIVVIDLFKMPRNMRDIFGMIRGEYGEHLKSNEVSCRYMCFVSPVLLV
jgi:translation initiation factor 2D